LIYTTPSHTSEAPRWRVLAPLSAENEPACRRKFVLRLNTALGGVLARESFTLSQVFYFGKVDGQDYRCLTTFGNPELGLYIDHLPELDEPEAENWSPKSSAPSELTVMLANEPLYKKADEIVKQLGRRLRTGDGRRELLKSYIVVPEIFIFKPQQAEIHPARVKLVVA
jgi:hypothetical protein